MKINQADIDGQAIELLLEKLTYDGALTEMLMDADDYRAEQALVKLLNLHRNNCIDLRDEALDYLLDEKDYLRDEAIELIIENDKAAAAEYADFKREEEQGMML